MLALVNGEPRVLHLKRMLTLFVEHRQTVLTRRTEYELKRAQARAHILEGLKIALDHLDAVIRAIRQSESAEKALGTLMTRWHLTEIQAKAILDMQLRRLAALERKEILDELEELRKTIAYLEDLLAHPEKVLALVREELVDLKKKFGDARRTQISAETRTDISIEDLIPNLGTLVTVSGRGYTKRVPPDTYRAQRRGGRGIRAMTFREEDAPRHIVVANAHDNILFFTDRGRVFQLKGYQIPEADRTARGTPIINLMNIDAGETVTAVVGTADFSGNQYLLMATVKGEIKKVRIEEFSSVRSSGLIAMDLEPGDELGWVKQVSPGSHVVLVTEQGQGVRFDEKNVPMRSRAAGGVRSVRLGKDDRVCAMDVVIPNGHLMIVSAYGHAKRTPLAQFPVHNRGVGGVIAQKITEKSGPIVTARVVKGTEEAMVLSTAGTILRTPVSTISVQGRAAQGVALIDLKKGDRVACVALLNGDNGEPDDEAPRARGRGRAAAPAVDGQTDGKATTSADAPTATNDEPPPGTDGVTRRRRTPPPEK
jgi:DNA gyrase subunit A